MWSCLLPLLPAQAQSELAATLLITQQGVELRRVNTAQWIALREGAITPLGTGDSIRTTDQGRALITVASLDILLLPLSEFTLERLATTDEGLEFVAVLTEGRSIQRLWEVIPIASFRLETPHLDVTTLAPHFGVEAAENSYVVAASGDLTLEADNATLTLTEGEGVRVTPDTVDDPVDLTFPASFAQVEGLLEGCPGTIQNDDGLDFRVRSGPSTDYYSMGTISDDAPVQLLATAGEGGFRWYRLQFQSDFGWVVGRVVQTQCDNLPDFPLGFNQEDRYSVRDVQPFEVELLQPFYGTPAEDSWFYNPE